MESAPGTFCCVSLQEFDINSWKVHIQKIACFLKTGIQLVIYKSPFHKVNLNECSLNHHVLVNTCILHQESNLPNVVPAIW